jgi:hypothetical protein
MLLLKAGLSYKGMHRSARILPCYQERVEVFRIERDRLSIPPDLSVAQVRIEAVKTVARNPGRSLVYTSRSSHNFLIICSFFLRFELLDSA